MGKSAFAINIVEHASVIEKIPTAFFSLEMSKEQVVMRMLCSLARVDASKVRTGLLASSDWPLLTRAAGKLSNIPFYIDDSPAISPLELRAKARRLKAHQVIQLIILDYMQLMRGSLGMESRQQEISEISRSLKALARELNIPIVPIAISGAFFGDKTDKNRVKRTKITVEFLPMIEPQGLNADELNLLVKQRIEERLAINGK